MTLQTCRLIKLKNNVNPFSVKPMNKYLRRNMGENYTTKKKKSNTHTDMKQLQKVKRKASRHDA